MSDIQADQEGAAMAEYGLLLVGIATVVGVAAGLFGGRVAALFGPVQALFP